MDLLLADISRHTLLVIPEKEQFALTKALTVLTWEECVLLLFNVCFICKKIYNVISHCKDSRIMYKVTLNNPVYHEYLIISAFSNDVSGRFTFYTKMKCILKLFLKLRLHVNEPQGKTEKVFCEFSPPPFMLQQLHVPVS